MTSTPVVRMYMKASTSCLGSGEREIDRVSRIGPIQVPTFLPDRATQPTTNEHLVLRSNTPNDPPTMPPNRARPRHRPLTLATVAGISAFILPTCALIRLYASPHTLWPLFYTAAVSGVTFLFYGYDKMQARNLEWRVQESTLHALAMAGGWPGALVGMHYFQHKTRKMRFQSVFWSIVMGWQGLYWMVWSGGIEVG